ncbi:hypothetical protein TraAM80_06501 [Trypanosoma rangeli]|uniref:EF-hand domain-containing protein n=1 Tax=Trypanosoma rangeli TaxID=5698 RepID=A0A3R7N8Q9_TRYRA|nr:uncharacterized protein TraAM80_06501 [Trypanosoma rangeli]RNF02270.1 hypothetical protein TraAM80_06501 [Trypanosoma rangeli]|eukprot:RNF02270.1 hypothetical protein TraAM80_06501 [Trypanosoma rangeli]
MYRSRGELRTFAQCVFALYCVDEGLSIARFRLAWYVLWGKWPNEGVIHLLFKKDATADRSEASSGEKNVTGENDAPGEEHNHHLVGAPLVRSAHPSVLRGRINEDEFIRFTVTYHDTMGADAVEFSGAEDTDAAMTDIQSAPSSILRARQWVQFQSLAGSKGYVTLGDLIAAENVDWLHRPVSGESEGSAAVKQADPDSSTLTQGGGDGRLAVLSHVFAIVDRDRDGKVVFDDVVRHLGTTA